MAKRKNVSTLTKVKYLMYALETPIADQQSWKTDVIGIAIQFSSNPKLKRQDFESILNVTVGDIIEQNSIANKRNKNVK